jgi:hypothetical protein
MHRSSWSSTRVPGTVQVRTGQYRTVPGTVVSAQAKRVDLMISPYAHIRMASPPTLHSRQPTIYCTSSHGVRVIFVLLACRVPTNRPQFPCKYCTRYRRLTTVERPKAAANAGDGGVCRVCCLRSRKRAWDNGRHCYRNAQIWLP